MAQYYVTIDGKEYQVNLAGDTATVNGEKLDVELISLDENGLYLLKRGHARIELYIHQINQGNLEVLIGRQKIEVSVEDFHRRNRPTQGQYTDGDLRAPMPGVVVEILAKEGQTVTEGDVLVIMESMKMKMQMRTLVSGQVKTVAVNPGQDVEKGDLLVAISQSLLEV
jgi:biotin carboxyl carrier protein